MLATIRFLTGPLKHRAFRIEERRTYRIGRHGESDIYIEAPDVSRRHARLVWDKESLVIEDEESTNGVDVNGFPTGRTVLRRGDTVALGSSSFRVESLVVGVTENRVPTETTTTARKMGITGEAQRLSDEFQELISSMQRILAEHRESMIEESLRILAGVLPASRLSLIEVDDEGAVEEGVTVAGKGRTDRVMSRTFARRVLERNSPVLVQDARTLDQREWGQTMDSQNVRSIMGVPVHSQNRTIAVLVADNVDEPEQFTQTHLRQLVFVSKVIEIAFQQEAFAKLDILSDFLPICASCKRIRDDKGYWAALESYFHAHADIQFSHTMCPECLQKHYPELYGKGKAGGAKSLSE